jgi:hypothetical protein
LDIDGHSEPEREAIFIRDGGSTREISREEWDRLNPGRQPVTCLICGEGSRVFSRNITHNLNRMADAAGIYLPLWLPDECGIVKAKQLVEPLTQGLSKLLAKPGTYKAFNPPNGWGDYDGLVDFVTDYLMACQMYPEAKVSVWR